MENFRFWYLRNQGRITWFLIGFLVDDACVQFGRGNLMGAALSIGLAAANYFLNKENP